MTDTEKLKQYKDEFESILPLFQQQQPLADQYQKLYRKYLDHYTIEYAKPIIKETIQEFQQKYPIENYNSHMDDDIYSYIGQLISNVKSDSSFQHFIFMKMVHQHDRILKAENEIEEFFQHTEESLVEEVRKLIYTVVESVFMNMKQQTEETKQRQQEKDELDKLRQVAIDYSQQIRHLKSDYENLKSRIERQKNEMKDHLIEEIMIHILPFLDQLELSKHHASEENGTEVIRGIGLVHDQMLAILKKEFNIQRMDSFLQSFDYNLHEAVSYDEGEGYPEGTIIDVLSPGYYLNERVIKHASVRVARSKS